MENKKLEIEIVKTDNINLIIVKVLKQIVSDTRGYLIESVEDVDFEKFNLQNETRDLCRKLFSIEGIFELELHPHQILVFKENKADWKMLEPQIISVFG